LKQWKQLQSMREITSNWSNRRSLTHKASRSVHVLYTELWERLHRKKLHKITMKTWIVCEKEADRGCRGADLHQISLRDWNYQTPRCIWLGPTGPTHYH
jgi:hypothetical protein